jgi:perosamine synthetase
MIPIASPCIGREEVGNVLDALESGWITSKSPFVERFERLFADYCSVRYGVSASSGTASLHLASKASGVSLPEAGVNGICSLIRGFGG